MAMVINPTQINNLKHKTNRDRQGLIQHTKIGLELLKSEYKNKYKATG